MFAPLSIVDYATVLTLKRFLLNSFPNSFLIEYQLLTLEKMKVSNRGATNTELENILDAFHNNLIFIYGKTHLGIAS